MEATAFTIALLVMIFFLVSRAKVEPKKRSGKYHTDVSTRMGRRLAYKLREPKSPSH